jgi:hypothetical protein
LPKEINRPVKYTEMHGVLKMEVFRERLKEMGDTKASIRC